MTSILNVCRKTVAGLWIAGSLTLGLSAGANTIVQSETPLSLLPDLATYSGKTPTQATPSRPLAEKKGSSGDAAIEAWLVDRGFSAGPVVSGVGQGSSATDEDNGDWLSGLRSADLTPYAGDYLVLHWGKGNANKFFQNGAGHSYGGFLEVFKIGSGTAGGDWLALSSLSQPGFYGWDGRRYADSSVGGLSWWRVYRDPPRQTPDAGATAVLLGAAVAVIGGLRRRFGR